MFVYNLTPEWKIIVKETLWYMEHVPCGPYYSNLVENAFGEEVNFSPKAMWCKKCYKNLDYEPHAKRIKDLVKLAHIYNLDVSI